MKKTFLRNEMRKERRKSPVVFRWNLQPGDEDNIPFRQTDSFTALYYNPWKAIKKGPYLLIKKEC